MHRVCHRPAGGGSWRLCARAESLGRDAGDTISHSACTRSPRAFPFGINIVEDPKSKVYSQAEGRPFYSGLLAEGELRRRIPDAPHLSEVGQHPGVRSARSAPERLGVVIADQLVTGAERSAEADRVRSDQTVERVARPR